MVVASSAIWPDICVRSCTTEPEPVVPVSAPELRSSSASLLNRSAARCTSGSSDCAASALPCDWSSAATYSSRLTARCCSCAAEPASAAAFSHDDIAMIMKQPIAMVRNSPTRRPAGHQRHEAQHEGPEGVDRDRHGRRIDDRGEEHEGRGAIEQPAHAEIGVNARRQRQHRQREPRHGLDALHSFLQARSIVPPQHVGRPLGRDDIRANRAGKRRKLEGLVSFLQHFLDPGDFGRLIHCGQPAFEDGLEPGLVGRCHGGECQLGVHRELVDGRTSPAGRAAPAWLSVRPRAPVCSASTSPCPWR